MDTGLTHSSHAHTLPSHHAHTLSALPSNPASLPVLEELAEIISELMKSSSFQCPDDLRKELKWIILTAYDARCMISDLQRVLHSRTVAVDWITEHLNTLRERHGWDDNRSESSQSCEEATCVCGDLECPYDDEEQTTLFEHRDEWDGFIERSRLSDSVEVSTPSTSRSMSEPPGGVEVEHVACLRNGLFAAPLAMGGVAITTTLTPSTELGTFAVLPNVPPPLLETPKAEKKKRTKAFFRTRPNRGETLFRTGMNANMAIRRATAQVVRGKPSSRTAVARPVGSQQTSQRRLVQRLATSARKTLWPIAIPAAVLAGTYLANTMLATRDFNLRII